MEKEEEFESYDKLIDSFKSVKKNVHAHFLLNTIITICFLILFYQLSKPSDLSDKFYITNVNTFEICLLGTNDLIKQNLDSKFLDSKIIKTLKESDLGLSNFDIQKLSLKSDFNCNIMISNGRIERFFKFTLEFHPELKFKRKISNIDEIEKQEI